MYTEKLKNITSSDELKKQILAPYENIFKNLNQVYIFGAKQLGQKTFDYCQKAKIEVLGFIDNNKQIQGKCFCDLPIFALEDLQDKINSANIIISSTNYLYEITQQVKEFGFKNIIPYGVLALHNKDNFPEELAFEGLIEDIFENKEKYLHLINIFKDDISKEILNNLIKFRLTFDEEFLYKSFALSEGNQYFDDKIISLSDDEIFVDGGGFNGDTTKMFLKKTNNKYKKIFFFEPDPKSYTEACKSLSGNNNIIFYNKGLFSEEKTLNFSSTGSLASLIEESGNTQIQVTSLDNVISDKISYIKLDIEGSEEEALKGAQTHIKSGAKLAISAYHKPSDLWKLTTLISSINSSYDLYLRHYTKSYFETVIYAVEREKND